jgi:hypothetical protein
MFHPDYDPAVFNVVAALGIVAGISSGAAAALGFGVAALQASRSLWTRSHWVPLLLLLPVTTVFGVALAITIVFGGV